MSYVEADRDPGSGAEALDVVGVGFGPSNLSLAIAAAEHNSAGGRPMTVRFVERQGRFGWPHADKRGKLIRSGGKLNGGEPGGFGLVQEPGVLGFQQHGKARAREGVAERLEENQTLLIGEECCARQHEVERRLIG